EREERTIDLPDPEATRALGRRLGEKLFPGAVIALVGQLGAGKTQLVRAVAAGLGVPDARVVTIPTSIPLQHHQGRRPDMDYSDVYRVANERVFEDLGVEEYLESEDWVCLIEWADRVAGCLPADHLRITLQVTGETSRRARLEATGPRHTALLRDI